MDEAVLSVDHTLATQSTSTIEQIITINYLLIIYKNFYLPKTSV